MLPANRFIDMRGECVSRLVWSFSYASAKLVITANSVTCVRPVVCLQSSHAELMMMESRKTSLLGRAESLKRSSSELPSNFHHKMHNLKHTWRQLEVTHTESSVRNTRVQQWHLGDEANTEIMSGGSH